MTHSREEEIQTPPAAGRRGRRVVQLAALVFRFLKEQGVGATARRARRWVRIRLAKDLPPYNAWIAANEPTESALKVQRRMQGRLSSRPLLSIVTPLDGTPGRTVFESGTCVRMQTYERWEWCPAGGQATDFDTKRMLPELAHLDSRIQLQIDASETGLSEILRRALRTAHGEFVLFLAPGDRLAPDALYEVARRLDQDPQADILYFDEDQITPDGRRLEPWFKPDRWSPELLLSVNYLRHAVIRRTLIEQAGGIDPARDGAWEWDLMLRCTEAEPQIVHISKVLYHARQEAAPPDERASDVALDRAETACVENHLRRIGLPNPQARRSLHGSMRVTWDAGADKVSVIIPTKENVACLRRCVSSLTERTAYPNVEIVLVDNGSCEEETREYYASLRHDPRFRIVDYRAPFNWSQANNLGARHATGDLLLFLNNDTEFLTADGLEELVRWAARKEIGVVGAKLLYPDGSIQHAGVIMGLLSHVAHTFYHVEEGHTGPFGSVEWYRNYMAVTGACMMMRRNVYEEVGGFDEGYVLTFSDIEICLRIVERGYRVVYTPFARLTHYEGKTRINYVPAGDTLRAHKHMECLAIAGDPYYNPNLTYESHVPAVASPFEEKRDDRLHRIVTDAMKQDKVK